MTCERPALSEGEGPDAPLAAWSPRGCDGKASRQPRSNRIVPTDAAFKGPLRQPDKQGMARSWVRGWLVVGLITLPIYFGVPTNTARAYVFIALNLATLVAIVIGIRRHRPRRAGPWLVLAAGYASYLAGDVFWFSDPPFPSAADAFFLLAYSLLALGLAMAVRARGSHRDRGGLLDALIVTGGLGVLSWVFIMSPYLRDASLSLSLAVSLAYPLVDLLLLGTLVRQSFVTDGRRAFFGLLFLGFLAQLGADTGYAVALSDGTFHFRHPILAGYLLSFIFVAAAALHPSMPAFTQELAGTQAMPRRWRLGLLGASALVPPVLLIAEALRRSFDHVVELATISAALFMLVIARVGQLLSDLSERRRIEARLREAESNYRHLVEQLPGVVYAADFGPEGRWTYVSPQIERMLGYSPEEWMSESTLWSRRIHPDDRERVLSAEADAIERRSEDPHDEYRLIARDGRIIWVSDEATLVRDDRGEPAFFRGVMFEITDRKGLEDQLRQSQKMEAIGLLAGGISHDFNNLLAIIRNYASFVAEEIEVHDPKHQDLQEVIRAANRGAQLTRQLLTFSRREVVQPRVLDLNEVVSDMHNMLTRTIPASVQLTTTLAPQLWKTRIDPGHVEQIVMNLAVYAKDAMPTGGRMTITTANAEVGQDVGPRGVRPGAYVTLAVSDTGCGMTTEVLGRVFEPFFTTKSKGQGTGLGLATVYGIVEQAGGHIVATSEVGRGTAFTVYLPRVVDEPAREPGVTRGVPEAGGDGKTILVVEDEHAVRDLVVRILRRAGYTVIAAESGVQAIRLRRTFAAAIDLLLTDVVMPDVSGAEVSARTGLPTVFMSGHTDEILDDQGVASEQVRLIRKPFSADELLECVRSALSTHSGSGTSANARATR